MHYNQQSTSDRSRQGNHQLFNNFIRWVKLLSVINKSSAKRKRSAIERGYGSGEKV